METRKLIGLTILGLLASLVLGTSRGEAAMNYAQQVRAEQLTDKTPENVVTDLFPILNRIPRTFIVGDGYKVHLTQTEMRIDHMATGSHIPVKSRTCMIGMTYMTPVAFFSTRVDIPLLASDTLTNLSSWAPGRVGDYVLYFSRNPVDHPTLQITMSAKF